MNVRTQTCVSDPWWWFWTLGNLALGVGYDFAISWAMTGFLGGIAFWDYRGVEERESTQ